MRPRDGVGIPREDYRATLTVMLGLGAATLTGFVREAALAYQLGAGRATDIYLIAFTIPEFFLVALPIVLWPAFIPLLADLRLLPSSGATASERDVAAWRFGARAAVALLALLLVGTLLIGLTGPALIHWLAPGFSPTEQGLALSALNLMLPSLVLMGAAALAGAMLQVYRRFARPALATAIYNITFVAALVAVPMDWRVGRAAWGVTLGAFAALLIQGSLLWHYRPDSPGSGRRSGPLGHRRHQVSAGSLYSGKMVPAPQQSTEDLPGGARQSAPCGGVSPLPGIKELACLAAPLAAGYAVHHAIYFIDRAMATGLAVGGVATLNYAYRLALVVGQLSGLAVSTAVFPRMAEQAAGDDLTGLQASLAGALRLVWTVGLPATAGLILLRDPLVQFLFERGAFDRLATDAVGGVLVWYALAVLADALCQPLWRILYARRAATTVLAVNSLQTGFRVFCNFALIGALKYNGLALSAALGLSLQVLVLGRVVWRQVGPFLTREWWLSAVRTAVATLGAAAVAGLALAYLPALPALALLMVVGTLGTLFYLGNRRLLSRWLS